MNDEKEVERLLGRVLAVEETETVAGAVTGPGDDGQTSPQSDAGTGCTGADVGFGDVQASAVDR